MPVCECRLLFILFIIYWPLSFVSASACECYCLSMAFTVCWPLTFLTRMWVLSLVCLLLVDQLYISLLACEYYSLFVSFALYDIFLILSLLTRKWVPPSVYPICCLLISLFCSVSAYQDVSAAHCASYSLSTNLSVCVSYQLVSCILCILFTACWSLSLYFCLLGCECPCLLELLPTDLYLTLLCLPACECYSVLSSSLPADLSPH